MAESPTALRRAGNEEFRRGQYGPAAALYTRALALLEAAGTERPGQGGGRAGGPRAEPLPLVSRRRGGRRRGAERAARQPRRLPPQGRRLQPLRRRLQRVSGGGAGGGGAGGLVRLLPRR